MILDRIENLNLYKGLSQRLTKALDALKDDKIGEKPDGRYDVDGDNIFYLVQRYKSLPFEEAKLEAHRKYIDVQFVAAGQEVIGYIPIAGMRACEDYNADNDAAFYQLTDDVTQLKLKAGMFCVFYPEDAHAPCRYVGSSCDVTKIVVKVKVNDD